MSISIHAQTVTSFTHALRSLSGLLEKATAHASASGYDPAVLLGMRLYPDMFPLTRQVQLATDFAKGGAGRLAGIELPKWPDTETTFAALEARLETARAFLAGIEPGRFEGAEARTIELNTPTRTLTFNGRDFLLQWTIPNVYFHVTTVYNILRHNGVPVGKFDFLGNV